MQSYRIKPRPFPKPHRSLQDTATPGEVWVHNGCTADLAIPCWYLEVHPPIRLHPHDTHYHDHIGWPSPNHPDHICQRWAPDEHNLPFELRHETTRPRWLLDPKYIAPIHLLSEDEGYSSVTVNWLSDHNGVTAVGWIDEVEDWVVRVRFDVASPNALEEPLDLKFAAFVNSTGDEARGLSARRDLVLLGTLHILPAAALNYTK